MLNGVPLTMAAFDAVLPYGSLIVVIGSILFGYSTIVGWAYYGEKCWEYLFYNRRSIIIYRLLFTCLTLIGVIIPLEMVWTLADISNAFMALPNLIALIALGSVISLQTHNFMTNLAREKEVALDLKA